MVLLLKCPIPRPWERGVGPFRYMDSNHQFSLTFQLPFTLAIKKVRAGGGQSANLSQFVKITNIICKYNGKCTWSKMGAAPVAMCLVKSKFQYGHHNFRLTETKFTCSSVRLHPQSPYLVQMSVQSYHLKVVTPWSDLNQYGRHGS